MPSGATQGFGLHNCFYSGGLILFVAVTTAKLGLCIVHLVSPVMVLLIMWVAICFRADPRRASVCNGNTEAYPACIGGW